MANEQKWEIVGSGGEPTGLKFHKRATADWDCADLNKFGVPDFRPYRVQEVEAEIASR